jgi:imidazole glycerol-phosphate synthase subunit HisH
LIVIIDYGMGNLGSIANMLRKIGVEALVSSNQKDIERATKLILPGVGAFDNGMKCLTGLGLVPVLNEMVTVRKIPLLGICLGMQLMTRCSQEGSFEGFGWLDAQTERFDFGGEFANLKVPHMGWNTVRQRKQSAIMDGMQEETRFYFVHSYHVVCNNSNDVLLETTYGFDFVSAVQIDNLIGVQFHPEKSHKYGMKLLSNFVEFV